MLRDDLKQATQKAKAEQEQQRKIDLEQAQAQAEKEVAEALPRIKSLLMEQAEKGKTTFRIAESCFKITDGHHFIMELRKHVHVVYSEGNLEFDWSQ